MATIDTSRTPKKTHERRANKQCICAGITDRDDSTPPSGLAASRSTAEPVNTLQSSDTHQVRAYRDLH